MTVPEWDFRGTVARANFYGKDRTVGEFLRRMHCSGSYGGRVEATWLETGPILKRKGQAAAGAVTRAGGAGVGVAAVASTTVTVVQS